MIKHPFFLHRYAEYVWLIQFDQIIDKALHNQIVSLGKHFMELYAGHAEIIFAYNSIMIRWYNEQSKTLFPDAEKLKRIMDENTIEEEHSHQPNIFEVPVCYDKRLDNDLYSLAQQYVIDEDEIIALHTSTTYHVYMLGFLPGFAYMGTVDKRISFPRKATPSKVRAGAVGIASSQTGIYPSDSPGGWNIVGYTPYRLFDINRIPMALIEAGCDVKFVPIELEEFQQIQNQ